VLVDEESDGLGRLQVAMEGQIQSFRDGDDGGSSSGDKTCEDKTMGPCLGVRRRETVQQNGLKRHGSFKSSGGMLIYWNMLYFTQLFVSAIKLSWF